MEKLKRSIRDTPLESIVKPVYTNLIRRPYWWYRREFKPITREIEDTHATFIAEEPADERYHELDSERIVLSDLLSELRPDDVFFDIGANIGLYSVFAANTIPDGEVFSFEPSPDTYEKLLKNIGLNDNQVTAKQLAVSDKDDTVEFAVDTHDAHSRKSTLHTTSTATEYAVQNVSSRKLETVVSDVDARPTVLKVDVEGAEFQVLSSLCDYSSVRIVYCEIHHFAFDAFDFSRSDIVELLEDHGFEIEQLYGRDQNECIKATRS